jgi:glycosyltransferase involved in cell wall biosynthesis
LKIDKIVFPWKLFLNNYLKVETHMFHIAHITLSMAPGGLENIIVNLSKETNKDLFKVTVGCLDSGGELIEQIHAAGHESFITSRKTGLDWQLIVYLAKSFAKKRFHIVHTHNQAAHFYAGIAAKLAKIPILVTTEHSRHNTDKIWRRQLEKRILCALSDKWITVSEEIAAQSIEKDGLPANKISVIRNGIKFSNFRKSNNPRKIITLQTKQELGLPENSKVIIMVARLHPIKNHALFLESFAGISKRCHNTHALIVGDGVCLESLTVQCKSLKIDDRVHFLGYRSDVSSLLHISDVFVLCSRTEGLPVSLLEACAAGVPVLITEKSNSAQLIENGLTGTVVSSNKEDIEKGLTHLLSNHSHVKQMAEKAAEIVKHEYSLTKMASRYDALYTELLIKKGLYNPISTVSV